MQRSDRLIALLVLVTLLNGLAGVLHGLFVRLPEPHELDVVLPFGVHHWSRLLTLVTGFLLLDLAYHLGRRRRAAWGAALATSIVAGLAHLIRLRHPLLALPSLAMIVLLVLLRRHFTVRSEARSVVQGLALVIASLVVAIGYGALGFWLLDRRDFGLEFHWQEACIRSLRQYALVGNPDLEPHTRHARWFLDSLGAMGVGAFLFGAFSLYRPLVYRLRTLPHERVVAAAILREHGRGSVDHFKLAADKSFFFGPGATCFIAYRGALGVAIGLGDPAGPAADIPPTLEAFVDYCAGNGWRVAFHQAGPDLLPVYRDHGFGVLKVGEEALVDLETFAARTVVGKEFRYMRNRAARLGLRMTYHRPPHEPALLDDLEEISNEWLSLPGRRERAFTLGHWDRAQVATTPVFVARDASGRPLAFANQIPCWPEGDTTIDLMRHRVDMPNGTMDFLFLETLLALAPGYRRFSFGLAPLAGVGDKPGATLEERAVHQLYERLNRFFSYKGLRGYKAKFEPVWEDRFLAYQGGPAGLVTVVLALTRVTEGSETAA